MLAREPTIGRRDVKSVVCYSGARFHIGLNALLLATKTLLDVYADLVGCLVLYPKMVTQKFHKGTWHGVKDAVGGGLLNWLSESTPQFAGRDALIAAIEQHVADWITDVVRLRDKVAHGGYLGKVSSWRTRPFSVLKAVPTELEPPTIGGQTVLSFSQAIPRNIERFLRETLTLLPNASVPPG